MKLFKTFFFLISCATLMYFSVSCERDDICAEDTETTALLIIKFLDDVTVSDIKQPVDLEIISTDPDQTDFVPNVVSMDSIMIPLKTNSTITEYVFTINATSDDPDLINSDTISFQYVPEEEYVNSACGFRVNYLGLGVTLKEEEDEDYWIENIVIQKEEVKEETTDETIAHVLIYH